jgi:hypothetical protein
MTDISDNPAAIDWEMFHPRSPDEATQPQGQLEPGNIDLHHRPVVNNDDGSISTVRSLSIEEDGKQVLIPTVERNGAGILSNEDAVKQYHHYGEHLGIFDTPENATAYAQKLHTEQESEYGNQQYWAQFNPRPATAVDGAPPNAAIAMASGTNLGQSIEGQKGHDITWDIVWNQAKQGAKESADTDGLGKQIAEQRAALDAWKKAGNDRFGGWEAAEDVLETAQKFHSLAKGVYGGLLSGGAALWNKLVGEEAIDPFDVREFANMPIGPGIPSTADLAATVVNNGMAVRAAPIILGKDGQMFRVTPSIEDGMATHLETKPIGTVPKPEDFMNAAKALKPGASPEALNKAATYMSDVWKLYGRTPSELSEAAQRSPSLLADIFPPEVESPVKDLETRMRERAIEDQQWLNSDTISGRTARENEIRAELQAEDAKAQQEAPRTFKTTVRVKGVRRPDLEEEINAKAKAAAERADQEGGPKPQPVGAAVSPRLPIADKPTTGWLYDFARMFNQLAGTSITDKFEMWRRFQKMGGPFDGEARLRDERQYPFGEGDTQHQATAEDQAHFEEHLRGLQEEQRTLFARVSDAGFDEEDIGLQMHRQVKGKTPEIDRYTGEASNAAGAPQAPSNYEGAGLLSRSTSAMRKSSYFVLQHTETGVRKLVTLSKDGLEINGVGGTKGLKISAEPGSKFRRGEPVEINTDTIADHEVDLSKLMKKIDDLKEKIDKEKDPDKLTDLRTLLEKSERQAQATDTELGRLRDLKAGNHEGTYTLERAWKREIEEQTPTRYYGSAAISLMDTVLRLRSVERAIYQLQRIKDTDEWNTWTTTDEKVGLDRGYIRPEMPVFRNTWMDPQLAHIIDDFWGKREHNSLFDTLEKINHFAIGSMFLTPFPHMWNGLTFWEIERGLDWVKPTGYYNLAITSVQAFRELVTRGPIYQKYLQAGMSTQYAPILTRNFTEQLLRAAGQEISKQESGLGWETLAKWSGAESGAHLYDMWQRGSNTVLWFLTDLLRVQRLMELERQGVDMEQAFKNVHDYTPSYRPPSEFPEWAGGRMGRNLYFSSQLMQFSPYHWDMMKFYGNIAKDATKAIGSPEARHRIINAVFGLAVAQLFVFPALNAMWTQFFPDQRVPSFGPGRLTEPLWGKLVEESGLPFPQFVHNYYHDYNNRTMLQKIAGMVPLSPEAQILLELVNGYRDSRTGRPIIEPQDWKEGRWGRVGGQMGEHYAGKLFEPYQAFRDAWRYGETAADALIEHVFGTENNGIEKTMAEMKADRYNRRAQRARHKRPTGPIEDLTK